MAHSLVFHSQRLSGHFTAENCPALWSCVGWTNQHLGSGDGQTQKLWHVLLSSSAPCMARPWHCAASTTTTIIRAVINFCQHHRNTKTPPAPIHPANTLLHKHTQGLSVCLLSKHPSHTQVIDFYSRCNLLDGQKKVSQSLHTVSAQCVYAGAQTYTNRLKLCV